MSPNEPIVVEAALEWFGQSGYSFAEGPQILPGELAAERDAFGEVLLVGRLREALRRLNPTFPEEAREEALRKVLCVATLPLAQTNWAFQRMLRDGVDVEYAWPDRTTKHNKALPAGTRGTDVLKRLLSNLGTIGNNLAELRGLYGTGHGKDGRVLGLRARHAKLAVGAAVTLATFLFETHLEHAQRFDDAEAGLGL